jgi:multidrug efflux pump subunit AcrA (membrane-fusion protein)
VSNALIVPVTALLAQSGGGYAVEVTGPGGHHMVAVTPGLFDDANGKIQVTGSGLAAGDQVVVAGS